MPEIEFKSEERADAGTSPANKALTKKENLISYAVKEDVEQEKISTRPHYIDC